MSVMTRKSFQADQHLPQAELHVHIEGTFEPGLMLEVAKRNDMLDRLPYKTVAEAHAAYQFTSLQSFLDLYNSGCDVLQTEQVCARETIPYLTNS